MQERLCATITMWRLLKIEGEQVLIGWMSGQPDGPGWVVSAPIQKIDRVARTAETVSRAYSLGHEAEQLPGGALDHLGDTIAWDRRNAASRMIIK
jgi:hypothetical protein